MLDTSEYSGPRLGGDPGGIEGNGGRAAGIIAPAIVATFISTLVAVVYCKVKDSRKRRV